MKQPSNQQIEGNPARSGQLTQNRPSARGRAFSRGSRGNIGNRPRIEMKNEYKEWDEYQSGGSSMEKPREDRKWGEETWGEYDRREDEERGAKPKEYHESNRYRSQIPDEGRRYKEDYRDERRKGKEEEFDQGKGYYTKEYEDKMKKDSYRNKYKEERSRDEDRKKEESRERYIERTNERYGERRYRVEDESPRRYRSRDHSPREDSSSRRGRWRRSDDMSPSSMSDSSNRGRGRYGRRGRGTSYGEK